MSKIYRKNKEQYNKNVAKMFYEANIAEFPLFLLDKKSKCDSIQYADAITIDGQSIRRTWEVTWPMKDGKKPVPPTPFVESVFLVLLNRMAQNNLSNPIISFKSRQQILQTIYPDRKPGKKDFKRLDDALFCLQNINIKSEGSFYDSEIKKVLAHKIEFNLFTAKITNTEAEEDGSMEEERSLTFVLNPMLYNQIKNGGYFWLNQDINELLKLGPGERRLLVLITKRASFNKYNFFCRNLEEFIKVLPLTDKNVSTAKSFIKEKYKNLQEKGYIPVEAELRFYNNSVGKTMVEINNFESVQTSFLPQFGDTSIIKYDNGLSYKDVEMLANEIAETTKDVRSKGSWILIAKNMPIDDINMCLRDVKDLQRSGYTGNCGAIFTKYIKDAAERHKINPWRTIVEIGSDDNVVQNNENADKINNTDNKRIYSNEKVIFAHNLMEEFEDHANEIDSVMSEYPQYVINQAMDKYYDHITKLQEAYKGSNNSKLLDSIKDVVRRFGIFQNKLTEVIKDNPGERTRQTSIFGDPKEYK
jgi:hypothetical protein